MSKKNKKKGDLLDFMLERALKIDILIDLYFDLIEMDRPTKESGEIWIDTKTKSEKRSIEDYYYRDTLILTVVNNGLNYEIKKGFDDGKEERA